MGIRTGQQYLEKLNAMSPHVVIDGEVVSEKIAEHPAFRNVARSYAQLFDMQHDPEIPGGADLRVAEHRRAGECLVPGPEDDRGPAAPPPRHLHLGRVLQRLPWPLRRLHELRAHGARHGRSGSRRRTRSSARTSATTTSGPGKTIVLATHTLIPPQVNRSVSGSEQLGGQLSARIVEEREDGIVIHGARMLATIAPIADELLVFPSTVLRGAPEDAPYSYAFAIPNDAPGLRYLCRTSLYNGGSTHDEPLASRYRGDGRRRGLRPRVRAQRAHLHARPPAAVQCLLLRNRRRGAHDPPGGHAHHRQERVLPGPGLGTGRLDRHRRVPAHPGGHRRADCRRRDRQGAGPRLRGRRRAQRRRCHAAEVVHPERRPQLVPQDGAALPADHPQVLGVGPHGAAGRGGRPQ